MKEKISTIILFLFLLGCNNTAVNYLPSNDGRFLTVVQYHKLSDPDDKGVYIQYGKQQNGKPSDNYVFVDYTEFAFYVKWEQDKVLIRCPGFLEKENQLQSDSIDFSLNFSQGEKEKYGFYSDRSSFYERVRDDFKSYTMDDLKKNWK
jgi:hypothetical protein